MGENENLMMDEEFDVDLSDIFETDADEGNQTDVTEEQEVEQAPETETIETAATTDGNQQAQAEPEMYELKVNKGIQKVTMDQMKEYAQQGLDYGRVRQQRDTLQQNLNEQMQWRSQNENTLTELAAVAQAAGMDVPGLLNSLRVNMLVQQGMSRETAQERIRAERAERQIEVNRQQAMQQQTAQTQQDQMRQRVARDMQEFQQMYPGVDIRNVPQEVIAEAASGRNSLVGAYARYENQQLQKQIKDLNAKLTVQEQNNNNKQRSLGSMKSSGNNSVKDDFLDGFND